jgi:hypothetical protein
MNAINLLDEQHNEVEQLFEEFEAVEDGGEEEKRKIFEEIADRMAIHASIEEKIFYPAVKVKSTEDILRESLEEHLSVKRLIADLMDTLPSDEQFDAKVTALKEQIEHHVKEEREEMFPKVRQLLTAEELEALGVEMEELAATMMSEPEPRANIPAETDVAPPL